MNTESVKEYLKSNVDSIVKEIGDFIFKLTMENISGIYTVVFDVTESKIAFIKGRGVNVAEKGVITKTNVNRDKHLVIFETSKIDDEYNDKVYDNKEIWLEKIKIEVDSIKELIESIVITLPYELGKEITIFNSKIVYRDLDM